MNIFKYIISLFRSKPKLPIRPTMTVNGKVYYVVQKKEILPDGIENILILEDSDGVKWIDGTSVETEKGKPPILVHYTGV